MVPGFFGFANLGEMQYFGHVADFFRRSPDLDAVVHSVVTHPTASLAMRAARLHQAIAQTSGPGDVVHLVGHSSGGMDARLLASPGVKLPGVDDVESVASRIRSVVSVSTPHHGTPSASFFTTLAGKKLLQALSLGTILVLRRGGWPLAVLVPLGDLARRADGLGQAAPGMLDHLFDALLAELDDSRRGQIEAFFRDVGDEQGLLPQIAPDAVELFNAATSDRPGVAYGSIVTRGRRPSVGTALGAGLSATAQGAHAWYVLCWRLAARLDELPPLPEAHLEVLRARWPEVGPSDNDGMVPAVSQSWGTVIRCVDADHLDILGHYGDPEATPPHYDWFVTGTGHRRPQWEATWTDVAHFLADGS